MTALSLVRPVLLDVDSDYWEVRVSGHVVPVTPQEFRLLETLRDARGRVVTRPVLADRLGLYAGGSRAMDVHVCRVRRKLGPAADLLVTVRGVGWRLL